MKTDHKALEQIRKKPHFSNNRLNSRMEEIHEYNFEVKYVKWKYMGLVGKLNKNQNEKYHNERDLVDKRYNNKGR